jgi:arginine repressor
MKRILKSESQRNIIKEIKDQNIKLIDSTTISLCLNMFGAKFRQQKGFKKYTRAGMTIYKFRLGKYNRSKNTRPVRHRSVSFPKEQL